MIYSTTFYNSTIAQGLNVMVAMTYLRPQLANDNSEHYDAGAKMVLWGIE